jgi:hypothetical protein
MDCREVQQWLLSADDVCPAAWPPGPAAKHLAECAECRQFAARLSDLEQAWREMPIGTQCEQSQQAFVERLAARPAEPRVSRRSLLQRLVWASAASLLAGAGGWLLFEERRAEASDALVDSLLDWNLRLTRATSADERARLYAQTAPQLASAVADARLPAEQSALAGEMLETGRWLAEHRDPLAEAARLDDLADRLLRMARAAEKKGKYQRMNRLLAQYNRAMETGIDVNLQRAQSPTARDAAKQQKLDRMLSGWEGRAEELARIEPTAPDPTRKEIQRALRFHQKHRKKVEKL